MILEFYLQVSLLETERQESKNTDLINNESFRKANRKVLETFGAIGKA